jgi:hypothetical protein
MKGTAGALFGAVIAATIAGVPKPAAAIGLCDCCANDLNQSCQSACEGQSTAPGQCTAIVDYRGKGATSEGKNPLTGVSLRELSLGEPTAAQLESFRRFLEAGRRRAITDYRRAAWRLKHGRIAQGAFDAAKALYHEALVNYYHGMRAYLIKVGVKSD